MLSMKRIPSTEKSGRLHTSTASVVVLPVHERGSDDIRLDEKDLRVDTYKSGGPGGQHANTTDSAVRVTYLPLGIQASSSQSRSQHDNKATALQLLRSKLLKQREAEVSAARRNLRIEKIGDGQAIRTYHYLQSYVNDHRLRLSHTGVENVLNQLVSLDDLFLDKLVELELFNKLIEQISSSGSTELLSDKNMT